MFRPHRPLFFNLFFSAALVACKENKVASNKVPAENKTFTSAQDSAYRRGFMFDKSKAPLLPAELIKFVYNPYVAFDFEAADLNQDGLTDYILTLVQPYRKDATGEIEWTSVPDKTSAPVLIIMRQTDGKLQFHSKNEVVFNQKYVLERLPLEGGIYADSIGNGFYFHQHSQGSGATATYTDIDYHFVLNKKSNKFYLTEKRDESGMVSPGGAREFMIEKAKTSGFSYDTSATDEEDYFPEVTVKKYKAGEFLFDDFQYIDINVEEYHE